MSGVVPDRDVRAFREDEMLSAQSVQRVGWEAGSVTSVVAYGIPIAVLADGSTDCAAYVTATTEATGVFLEVWRRGTTVLSSAARSVVLCCAEAIGRDACRAFALTAGVGQSLR